MFPNEVDIVEVIDIEALHSWFNLFVEVEAQLLLVQRPHLSDLPQIF